MGGLVYLMAEGIRWSVILLKWLIIVELAFCVALGWSVYAMMAVTAAAFGRRSVRIAPLSRALRSAGIWV